jgi:hypothetical protein
MTPDEKLAEELGPLPTIHPRETVCRQAQEELFQTITTWRRKWGDDAGLTPTERLSIIQHVLNDEVGSALKYAIRVERHGDANKPGGIT